MNHGPGTVAYVGKVLTAFALAALFFSCTSSNRIEGYVYYRLNASPSTLDPALIADVPSATIAAKLYNGLVRLRDDLGIAPDIAMKWSVSADGLRYTFHLRKGVRFLNGREVKASDFKYSFERVLDPATKSPNTWVFGKVEGAEEFLKGRAGEVKGFRAKSDYVFEITLKKPFSPFLSMLTMPPAYVVPHEEVEKWGADFSSHPSGTGPFILKKWLPDRELLLARRTDYFGDGSRVRGIAYRIIAEDLTAVTEFELGNLDVIAVPASAYARFRNDERWNRYIISLEGLNTYYLGMNTSRPPFDDPEVRRAVSVAIDREKILNTFYEGRGRLAEGPVPHLLRRWKTGSPLKYDPDRARRIIREKGLTGMEAQMYVSADKEVVDLAEIIQAYLERVGIRVKIKQLEWSAYKEAVNRGEPDMFWLSWWADYPDPENFLFPLFHSRNIGPGGNRVRYVNKEVDSLIEKGQYAVDEKDRDLFYQKAEEIIIEESPWVFFWHKTDYVITQPWIRGCRVYPVYSMDKGTEITIHSAANRHETGPRGSVGSAAEDKEVLPSRDTF
ncbi:MAG: ABC transporter substrate-binding protein [Nitrospirae bacterium]|nr:ABC transporter substrate-binding protein [Nitrospirota bacterium]